MTRGGQDARKWFPEVADGLAMPRDGPHALDGEICVLHDVGRSNFKRLFGFEPAAAVCTKVANRWLLKCKGEDMTHESLWRPAKHASQGYLPRLHLPSCTSGTSTPTRGEAKELRLEGLVAKRLGPYIAQANARRLGESQGAAGAA